MPYEGRVVLSVQESHIQITVCSCRVPAVTRLNIVANTERNSPVRQFTVAYVQTMVSYNHASVIAWCAMRVRSGFRDA